MNPMIGNRAFTLAEAAIVTMVLALTVPPAVAMLSEVGRGQADAVQAARATTLAQSLLEQVVADTMSDDAAFGFAGLDDAAAYESGLRTRLAGVVVPAETAGLSWGIVIGPLVSASGSATGDTAQDVFRLVTVTVETPLSSESRTLSLATMVGDL